MALFLRVQHNLSYTCNMLRSCYTKHREVEDVLVQRIYEVYPDLRKKYGERGRQKCREDSAHHFDHLATAYEFVV